MNTRTLDSLDDLRVIDNAELEFGGAENVVEKDDSFGNTELDPELVNGEIDLFF